MFDVNVVALAEFEKKEENYDDYGIILSEKTSELAAKKLQKPPEISEVLFLQPKEVDDSKDRDRFSLTKNFKKNQPFCVVFS